MPSSASDVYSLRAPPWRARLNSLAPSLGWPDLFPAVAGASPEMSITPASARSGYTAKPATKAEGFSAHDLIYDRLSTTQHLVSPLLAEVATRQDELARASALPSRPAQLPAWPRVTLNEAKLTAYLRDLADPAVPLSRLARSVPHGIRGERLIEMLYLARPPPAQENEPKPPPPAAAPATPELGTPAAAGTPTSASSSVPTPVPVARAAWFLHTVGAIDLQSARAKPPPVAVDLTQALATTIKRLIDAIPAPSDSASLLTPAFAHAVASSPSEPAPSLGIPSSFATPQWTHRLSYLLTLSRVMGDLGLLHPPTWLRVSSELLATAHAGQVAFVLPLLQDGVALFAPGGAPLPLARLSLAALAQAHATVSAKYASLKGEGRALATSLRNQTTSLARRLVLSSPRVLVGPRLWAAHGAALPSVLGLCEQESEYTDLRVLLQRAHKRVQRINLLQEALRRPPSHSAFDTAVSLNHLLDALDPSCDPGAIFALIFGLASTPIKTQRRVEDLLLWASCPAHFPSDETQDWPAGSGSASARIALASCWLVYLHGCGYDVPSWLQTRLSTGEISREEHASLLGQAIPIPDAENEEPRAGRLRAKAFSLDTFLPLWLQEVQQAHESPSDESSSHTSKLSLPLPRPSPRPSFSSQARSAVEFAPLASLVECLLAQEIVSYDTLLRASAPGFRTGQPSLLCRVVRSVALPPGVDKGARRRTIYPNRPRDRETWDEAMERRSVRELEAVLPFVRGEPLGEDQRSLAALKEEVQASLPHVWASTPYVQRTVLAPVVKAVSRTMPEWRPFSPSLGSGELQRVLFVLHQAGDWDALAQALFMTLHDLAAQEAVRYMAALPLVETYIVSHALLWTARGELLAMVSLLAQCARHTSSPPCETGRWARAVLLSLMRAGNAAAQEAIRDVREPLPLVSVVGDGPVQKLSFDEARAEALSTLQACSHRPHELAQTLQALKGYAEPSVVAAVQVSVQLHISLEGPDHPAVPKLAAASLDGLDQTILGLLHETPVDVDAVLAVVLEAAPTGALLRALPALTPLFLGLLRDRAVGMDNLMSLVTLPFLHNLEHHGPDTLTRFLHDVALGGGKMSLPTGKEIFRSLDKATTNEANPLPILLSLVDLTHPSHRPILWGELHHPQLWKEGIRAVAMGHGSVHPPPLLAGGPIAELVTPWSMHTALERISTLPATPLVASSPLAGLSSKRAEESEESSLAPILVERLFSPASTIAGERALAISPPSLSTRVHTLLLTVLVRAVEGLADPSHAGDKGLDIAQAALARLVRIRHVAELRTIMPSDVPYWSALIHAVLKLLTWGESAEGTKRSTTLAIECVWLLCQPNEWWTASPAVRGVIPRLYQRIARVLIASASRGDTSMVALCLDSLLTMLEDAPASLLTLCQQGVSLAPPVGNGRDLAWLRLLPPALALDVVRVLILPPQSEKVVLAPSLSVAVGEAYFVPVETKAWELVPSLRSSEGSTAPPGTEAYTTTYDPLGPIPDQGPLSLASFAARKGRDGPRLHLLPHPRPIAPHDDSMISRSIEAERSYGAYATDPPELRAARIQAPALLRYQSQVEERARIVESPLSPLGEESDPSPLWSKAESDCFSPVSSELSESEPEPEESPAASPAHPMLLKHKPASAAPSPLARSPRSPSSTSTKDAVVSPAAKPAGTDARPPARKRPRPRPARPKVPVSTASDAKPSTPPPAPGPVDSPKVSSKPTTPRLANPKAGQGHMTGSSPNTVAGRKRKAAATVPPQSGTPLASPARSKPLTHACPSDSATVFHPPPSAPIPASTVVPASSILHSSQPWSPPAPYAALFPDPSTLLGVSAMPAQPLQPLAHMAGPATVVGTVSPSQDPQAGVQSSAKGTRGNARTRSRGTARASARGTTKRSARGRGKVQTSDVYPEATTVSTLQSAARTGNGPAPLPQFSGATAGMQWPQDPSRLQPNVPSVPHVPQMPAVPPVHNVPSGPHGPQGSGSHTLPSVPAAPSVRGPPTVPAGSLTVPLHQSLDPRLSPAPVSHPAMPHSHQTALPPQMGVPSQAVDPYLPSTASQGSDPFFSTSFLEPGGMDAPLGHGIDTWFNGMFGYNGAPSAGVSSQDEAAASHWNFLA